MEYVKIGDLCNESSGLIAAVPDEIIDYVDISSVDNAAKRVTGYESIRYADAPSRARRQAEKGCIIVSTVRPNLNAVAMCDFDVPHRLVVSTGFCVLSCKAEVDPDYVFLFCQSPKFIETLVKQATGASYPAVNDTIIRSVMLPAYSYAEQTEIASRLKALKKIIESRQRQLRTLDTLIKARFVEMFGDVKQEDTLLNLCNIIDYRGKTPEKVEDGLPFITAKNVRMHQLSIEPREYISKETYDSVMTRGFPREGDVVFTTEAPLGNVCRLPHFDTEFYVGQRIVTLQTERLAPAYLEYALDTDEFRRKVEGKSSGSTVTGIRVRLLEQLTIPVPNRVSQNQFAAFVSQVDKSKAVVQAALDKAQLLFNSLMQQYFG